MSSIDRRMDHSSARSLDSSRIVAFVVNGEDVRSDTATTVATLLEKRGLTGKRVAVERNGAIVPRSRHAETRLEDGDRIEIVVAVGGG